MSGECMWSWRIVICSVYARQPNHHGEELELGLVTYMVQYPGVRTEYHITKSINELSFDGIMQRPMACTVHRIVSCEM